MRTFLRWWETLGRPERIVAMSLTAGSIAAIANSTTWAIAVCYMTRQKALVAMRAPLAMSATAAENHTREYPRAALHTPSAEAEHAMLGQ